MKIHLKRIKANVKFHGKNTGFVDSGFVKTCDELVIGAESGGDCWERIITLIKCPFIALSATVENPKDLINWLQSAETFKKVG